MKTTILVLAFCLTLATSASAVTDVKDITKSQDPCRDFKKIMDCSAVDVRGAFTPTDVSIDDVALARAFVASQPAATTSSQCLAATASSVTEASASSPATDAGNVTPAAIEQISTEARERLEKTTREAVNEVEVKATNVNAATVPPPSSEAAVHASRENFNIPLSLAITSIERT